MTIVEFLTARLNEDQAQAEAAARASGAHWTTSEYADDVTNTDGGYVACGPYEHLDERTRYFIARHDPAAVLADIAAKRAILDDYSEAVEICEQVNRGEVVADIEAREVIEIERAVLLRPVQRILSAYHAHSDFQQEWAE